MFFSGCQGTSCTVLTLRRWSGGHLEQHGVQLGEDEAAELHDAGQGEAVGEDDGADLVVRGDLGCDQGQSCCSVTTTGLVQTM